MQTQLKPAILVFFLVLLIGSGTASGDPSGGVLNGYIVSDEGMASIGSEDVADVYLKYSPEGAFAVVIELNDTGKPKANKLFAAAGKKLMLTAGGHVVMNPMPIAGGRDPNSASLRIYVKDERAAVEILKSLTKK